MRKTLLPIILCLFALFGVAQAQTTTVGELTADHVAATPTEGESYYLLSAADQRVPGDPSNGLTADFFPMYEKNFVVYNSSTNESRYTIHTAQFTNNEQFKIVKINGESRLLNVGTGGYMTGSWGSNEKGEKLLLQLISGTQKQYIIKTGSCSPLWIKCTTPGGAIIADRYNYDRGGAKNKGKTTAWFFIPAADVKAMLYMRLNEARLLMKQKNIGTQPGELLWSETERADFKQRLASIESSTDMSQSTLRQLVALISDMKKTIAYPQDNQHYFLRSGSTSSDLKGALLTLNSEGRPCCTLNTKAVNANMVWMLEKRPDGKRVLVNYNTKEQIQPVTTTNEPFSMGKKDVEISFSYLDNQQFNIIGNNCYYHCPSWDIQRICNWKAGEGTGSAWYFEPISEEQLKAPVEINEIVVSNAKTTTGKGNQNVPVLRIVANVSGFQGEMVLSKVKISLKGTTNLNDIKRVCLYASNDSRRLRPQQSTLLSQTEGPIAPEMELKLNSQLKMLSGDNIFYITCDVDEQAKEGNLIQAQLVDMISAQNKSFKPSNGKPSYPTTIFLTESVVLAGGDYGSKNYRIPAIITADDGALVTVTDRRINNNVDLPQHIDLYVNRSTDNGKTWSKPICIAGDEPGTIGYGDAAILKNKNGRLIVLYNGGKAGLFNSTSEEPFRKYKVHSDDNGKTWTKPVEITHSLYGAKCSDPIARKWTSMLLTSGRGICTRDGVLMVAVAAKVPGKNGFSDYACVSYDDGETWKIESSQPAWDAGDEAKLVELNNGDILISMRRSGGREFNVSHDKGKTWGTHYTHPDLKTNPCNGSMIVYSSTKDGASRNRLLHTFPDAGSRKNVSCYMSYDEGKTFPVHRTLCPDASAYSSLTVLPDGTIGCYLEDGASDHDLVFIRFSLDWLTNHADSPEKSELSQVIRNAQTNIGKMNGKEGQPGYPTLEAANTLKQDLETAQNLENDKQATASQKDAAAQKLAMSLEAYLQSHALPEDGKTYTFTFKAQDGEHQYYICYDSDAQKMGYKLRTNAPLPRTANFICHRFLDEKGSICYVFSDEEGHYLSFFGKEINNPPFDNKGYSEGFDQNFSTLQFGNLNSHLVNNTPADKDARIGCLSLVGIRYRYEQYQKVYFSVYDDGKANGATVPVFKKEEGSSAVMVEESAVPYNNTVFFNTIEGQAISGLEEGCRIATFSAPFATILPENIRAFHAADYLADKQCVKMEEIKNHIPAKQGIILVSEKDCAQTLLTPAATEVKPLSAESLSFATLNTSVAMTSGNYVLANTNNITQFYKAGLADSLGANKSYLHIDGIATPALGLSFGDIETGIEQVDSEIDEDTAIYDLAGRRVNATTQSGIYIRKGKVFIKK